ncbi:WD40 repeat domain-containing protein, partial [Streptomyces clavuligerus]
DGTWRGRRVGRPERPVHPDAGPVARFAGDLRQLRAQAGAPSYRLLARRAHYSPSTLAEAAKGHRLPTLEVAVALAAACGGDRDEWTARWRAAAAAQAPASSSASPRGGPPTAAGSLDPGQCPYPGLAPFGAEDAAYFFGRGALVEQLSTMVTATGQTGASHGPIALFGASGSGKSSLVRAGLLPGLDNTVWRCATFTPGPDPLGALAGSVAALTGVDARGLREGFAATDPTAATDATDAIDSPGPARSAALTASSITSITSTPRTTPTTSLHRALTGSLPSATRALLVIDQFEEVFTMGAPARERDIFVRLVAEAARGCGDRLRVLIVARSDFYTHCSRHPHLVAALRAGSHLPIGPPTGDELHAAIVGPARLAGLTVESALVGALRTDTADQPGALALLAHALRETCLRRTGDRLSLADYHATGGVRGAVAQSAELLYARRGPAEQRLMRALFLRLTALGDGTDDTRRRIDRHELEGLAAPADLDRLLDELARARLVVLGSSGHATTHTTHDAQATGDARTAPTARTVDIAHEAVIAAWPRLRRWLLDGRDALRVHRRVTQAADLWHESGQDRSTLYRGGQLGAALTWAREHPGDLNEQETAFLAAGRSAHRRRRWAARALVAVVTALALLATLQAVLAERSAREATRQRDLALSQSVAAQASALRATDPALSARLGLAAYRVAPTVAARSTLLSGFAAPYATRLTGHRDHVNSVAFAPAGPGGPGGTLAATASRDRTAVLWDTRDPHRPHRLGTLRGHTANVTSAVFTPDGNGLATTGWDERTLLWDVTRPAAPRVRAELTGHTDDVNTAAFSPDGRLLATGSTDNTVRVWDLEDLEVSAVSEESEKLDKSGKPEEWGDPARTARPRPLATLRGHRDTVVSAAFAPDGHTLATGDWKGGVRLWDLSRPAAPRALAELPPVGGPVRATFAPAGNLLVTAGQDRTVRLWDLTDPRHPRRTAALGGHTDTVRDLRVSPDGTRLATVAADRTVRLWPLRDGRVTGEPRVLTGHTNAVVAADFSPDGRFLATASDDRTARVWDLASLGLTGHTDAVYGVALHPGGRLAATGSFDRTVRLWSVTAPGDHRPGARLTGHGSAVNDVAFNRTGTLLASASADHTVRLWHATDPARPRPATVLREHTDAVNTAAFDSQGRGTLLLTGGTDRAARLWDTANPAHPRLLSRLTGHTDGIDAALLRGPLAVTASADRTVRLWDVTDPARPRPTAVLRAHADAVKSIALSPDGRHLATASADGTIRLWDLGDRAHPRPPRTLTGHTDTVHAVAFSADGHRLASAGADHAVRVWSLRTGSDPRPYATLTGHRDTVYALAFAARGDTLLTGGQDGVALLWTLDTGEASRWVCETAVATQQEKQGVWRTHLPETAVRALC